jgi:protein-S-isoprenylcysteine O-methyltransferase Ste14
MLAKKLNNSMICAILVEYISKGNKMLNDTTIRKLRILLTRIISGILAIIVLISNNYWENIDMIDSIFFLIGVLLVGIASIGRIWCSLYISGYKSKTLVTEGPYSISRNPLYFFSMLGSLGIGLATETLIIPAVLMISFAIYYPHVIKREERNLSKLYGRKYQEYHDRTPAFIPKFSLLIEPTEYVVKPVIFRKHIFDTLIFIWLIGIIEFVEGLHESNILPSFFTLY